MTNNFVKINVFEIINGVFRFDTPQFIALDSIESFGQYGYHNKYNGYETAEAREINHITEFDVYFIRTKSGRFYPIDSLSYDLIVDALSLE